MQWLKGSVVWIERYNVRHSTAGFVDPEAAGVADWSLGGFLWLLLDGKTVMAGRYQRAELACWFEYTAQWASV